MLMGILDTTKPKINVRKIFLELQKAFFFQNIFSFYRIVLSKNKPMNQIPFRDWLNHSKLFSLLAF